MEYWELFSARYLHFSLQLLKRIYLTVHILLNFHFPGGSDGKASAYNGGRPGFNPWVRKEMAPHSSTLAWKIPWMEEPGRLQFVESQRVGHDWVTSLSFSLFIEMIK